MPDPAATAVSGAVFLSYASQDAESVLRIAEALRAVGIEVWFDKDELTGGDAWDLKIRKQIKECALFVPVISATTNARREGYFRREWKIAVDRTHDMDEALPFLVPVVIDGTTDAGAFVPEKFREVQWTRLPGGETPPAFCAQMKHLLGGEVAPVSDRRFGMETTTNAGQRPALPQTGSRRVPTFVWIIGFAVLAVVAFFTLRPRRSPEEIAKQVENAQTFAANAAARSVPAAPPPAPPTKAQQLVAQARALYEPWDFASADDFKLAEQLLKQATELEPANADAWAALAIEATGQNFFGYDRSDARDLLLRSAAERAVKLAPDSDDAKLALGLRYRRGPGTDDDAVRVLGDLATRHGTDKFILRQFGSALVAKNRDDEALTVYARAAALPGGDAIALVAQERVFERHRRFDEAEAALDRALALRPDYGFAHVVKIVLLFYQRGDLELTRRALEKIPPSVMSDDRVASVAAFMWYFAREPDKAADALRYVSRDYIESNVISAPKGLMTGLVHQEAGRNDAAAIEWRQALRVVEQRLALNPTSSGDIGDKASLLALLGERAAAEEALRVFEQLRRLPAGRASASTWQIYAALNRETEVADFFTERLQPKALDDAPAFAAMFRFHPALDLFRDRPRFRALAGDVDRFYAAAAARHAATAGAPAK